MGGHHIVSGDASIALPVVVRSQTMTDFVGKCYFWIGLEGTPIEAHNAGVLREIAIPAPGLAEFYCINDIILADPSPFGQPLVTNSSKISLVVSTGKYFTDNSIKVVGREEVGQTDIRVVCSRVGLQHC